VSAFARSTKSQPALSRKLPQARRLPRECSVGIRSCKHSVDGFSIPQVTIKTGLKTPDGHEELLTEYFCDRPGCPNIATHVLGCAADLGLVATVCDDRGAERLNSDLAGRPVLIKGNSKSCLAVWGVCLKIRSSI
jgi:hypothetical protein